MSKKVTNVKNRMTGFEVMESCCKEFATGLMEAESYEPNETVVAVKSFLGKVVDALKEYHSYFKPEKETYRE